MNQSEYLSHSSGPWKKHKYFKKIGEGANAVYKYAKNAANDVTGGSYKKEYNKQKELADRAEYYQKTAQNAVDVEKQFYKDYKQNRDNIVDAVNANRDSIRSDSGFLRDHREAKNMWEDAMTKKSAEIARETNRAIINAQAKVYHEKKAQEALNDYKTKSLFGKANATVSKGMAIINKLFGRR
jgi:hypothetical protein